MKDAKKQSSWKEFIQELLYEFYAQVLMQNQFSFTLWLVSYILSYLQILDYIFHPFVDSVMEESFVSSLIVNVFQYSSVFLECSNE
jgi:hypothetical protein